MPSLAPQSPALRFRIRNDLSEVSRVNDAVTGHLERRGAGERLVYATQLAIEEVLSNVIRHAFGDGSRHEIALSLRVGEAGVEMEVVDDGRAFDPTAAPEPERSAALATRKPGGFGIHLVRAFSREIRYQRLGGLNKLWLRI